MTEISERFRNAAAQLTQRVDAVPDEAWGNPSPCEGWVARDVVRHLVETSAYFLGRAGVELPAGPSVDDDPAGAWRVARDTVQSALDDPATAEHEYDTPMGRMTLEQTIAMFGVADVVVHTWDLARATGLDERLDPAEVDRILAVMEPNDELMRQGTAFGPRVAVPDGADPQTRLIAFTGRQP